MRTITLTYEGLEDVEVQIATGQKMIECQKIAEALPERKEGGSMADEEKTKELMGMCEIISKCTRFTQEEAFETFGFSEIQEIFGVIMGDRQIIKKTKKQS
jgi:hypothetical protein